MSTQQVNYAINVTGNLEAKLKKATAGFDKLDNEVDGLKKKLGKASGKGGSGLAGSFAGLGGVIAGAFAVERVIAFGKASVAAFDKQEQAIAQVRTGLMSTGNTAGRTLEQLTTQASELQKKTIFGDEEILQGATAQLLTFTNIAGKQFDRTQMAVLDLSSRLGVDLKSSAIQLGKALNDPVANLSALSRSGIQFTTEQKATIKSLTETNRLAEAQTLILNELEKQYGGSAEAAAKAGLGPFKQLQNAFGDFQEKIGESIAGLGVKLIPVMEFLINNLDDLLIAFKDMFTPIVNIGKVIFSLFPKMGGLAKSTNVLAVAFKVLTAPTRLAWWLLEQLVTTVVRFWEEIKIAFNFLSRLIPSIGAMRIAFGLLSKAVSFFMDIWKDLPLVLDAAWGSVKQFFRKYQELAINTAKNVASVFKELSIVSIIKNGGDTSAISAAISKVQSDFSKGVGSSDISKDFNLRLSELVKQRAIRSALAAGANTSLNATETGGTGTTDPEDLADVSADVTGTKATNINLNIEKLIENLNFNTSNLSETTGKIKEEVTKVLIEALRDTTAIATN